MCANAITRCQRLVQAVVHSFTSKQNTEFYPSKIKSVILVKVNVSCRFLCSDVSSFSDCK